MFTLVGYSQSQIGNPGLLGVNALADPHIRVVAKDIIVPAPNKLIGVYGIGTTLVAAQLQSPTLRRVLNYDVRPVEGATVPPNVARYIDLSKAQLSLSTDEAIDAFVTDTAAGAEQDTVLIWLGDGTFSVPAGDIFSVKATGATTLVAYAWTNGSLTFTQTLPAGRYAVVGMRAESTGLIAARLVFVGYQWRPGCIGFATSILQDVLPFRQGDLGTWGEFQHNTPPTVDFLSSSADTAETIILDLVKVG